MNVSYITQLDSFEDNISISLTKSSLVSLLLFQPDGVAGSPDSDCFQHPGISQLSTAELSVKNLKYF